MTEFTEYIYLNYEICQSIFQSKTLDQSSKKLFVQTFLDIKKEKTKQTKKKKARKRHART